MSANTILLDFSVRPDGLGEKGFEGVEEDVVQALGDQLKSKLEKLTCRGVPTGGDVSVYLGPRGSVITIRLYPNGLVTVNIDYYLNEGENPLLTLEDLALGAAMVMFGRVPSIESLENVKEMEMGFGKQKDVTRVKTFPALRRGAKIDVYMTTTDERLLEYDIDKIVYDARSPFQHIQIVHSPNFGNLLILDDLQNLAESDLIYTEAIMCRGVEVYKGKEVLILGGGDGALLYEMRKENPKFVTMIEIDKMVMDACAIHLRSACGDTLDNYKTDQYEIIVGDCVEFMEKCAQEGKKFDYVFADLTDIPISPTPQGEVWDFIKLILNLSFGVLKDDGKYMTHGNGVSSPKAMEMYEQVLSQLSVPVKFTKTHSFVPSFMEDWVFYQIQKNL